MFKWRSIAHGSHIAHVERAVNYLDYVKLEGAHEKAYLRQENFYRRPLLAKFLRGHVWTVPGNMHVKSEVCGFNRFGAIST